MKVIKIDIQKTIVEAPEDTQQLKYFLSSGLVGFLNMDTIPSGPMLTEKYYNIRRVIAPDRQYYFYAVAEDETGIFNDLIKVSNDYIIEKIAMAGRAMETEFNTKVIPEIQKHERTKTINEIKALPWIKRLLNKF